ncbi:MAG TPA: hypothetical protein VFI22_01545, partial [Thermomicrobiales bacterium]|nr:hypothetical protein [Thermomicrobiales bacterium]
MRVVMFGMACAASAPALAALLAAGVDVPLLVVGEVRRAGDAAAGFGAAGGSAPERLAGAAGLPVIRCGRVEAALIETIAGVAPDAIA